MDLELFAIQCISRYGVSWLDPVLASFYLLHIDVKGSDRFRRWVFVCPAGIE